MEYIFIALTLTFAALFIGLAKTGFTWGWLLFFGILLHAAISDLFKGGVNRKRNTKLLTTDSLRKKYGLTKIGFQWGWLLFFGILFHAAISDLFKDSVNRKRNTKLLTTDSLRKQYGVTQT